MEPAITSHAAVVGQVSYELATSPACGTGP
jgi:hypothetical protein